MAGGPKRRLNQDTQGDRVRGPGHLRPRAGRQGPQAAGRCQGPGETEGAGLTTVRVGAARPQTLFIPIKYRMDQSGCGLGAPRRADGRAGGRTEASEGGQTPSLPPLEPQAGLQKLPPREPTSLQEKQLTL